MAAVREPDPAAGEYPGGFDAAFFTGILESSPDPYVVVDRNGVIRWASRSGAAIVGRTPEQYVGCHVVEILAPASIDNALVAFAEYTNPDRVDTGWVGPPMPLELQHVDGSTVPVEIRQVPSAEPFPGIVLMVTVNNSMNALYESIERIVADEPLDKVMTSILRLISIESPISVPVIGRGWDGTTFADVVAADGAPSLDGDHLPAVAGGRSPWHARLTTGESIAEHDLTSVDSALRAVAEAAGLPSCWVLPVPASTRGPSSVDHDVALILWRRVPGPPRLNVANRMERIVSLIGLAVNAAGARHRLRAAARTDPVTGLLNRTALSEHLGELVQCRDDGIVAVLFCDLDHFKAVNDDHGHSTGDRVLAIVADRLRSRLRTGDVVARVGGDEFVVVSRADTRETVQALAERLITAFDERIAVNDVSVPVGISIGVAIAPIGELADFVSGEQLIERADAALLRAKHRGRRRVIWAD